MEISDAEARLKEELEKGRLSGEEKGWIAADDVRKHFEEKRSTQ